MEKQTINKTNIEKASDISSSATKIYMDITDIKEFSKSYLEELLKENEDLKDKLNKLLERNDLELEKATTLSVSKEIKRMLKIVAIMLVNLALISIAPTIGLFTTPIYMIYVIKSYKSSKENSIEYKKRVKEIRQVNDKSQGIKNNLDNNELFIKRELKKFEVEETKKVESQEASKSKSQEVSKVELANKVIQDFYETGIIPEISDELKETIIALLKNSVECKEINIITILEESRKKVNYEDSKSAKLELNKNGKN